MTTLLDPRRVVFIDVDTQVDFVEPEGALYVPGAEGLKPAFTSLLEAAADRGSKVIASADAHGPEDPEFEQFPPHCVTGTPGQKFIPETEPESARIISVDGEERTKGKTIVLEKVKFDLFANPFADRALEEAEAHTAVVFGLALDFCVRAAALGLRRRGFDTIVVSDATLPVTPEGGQKAEAELREAGVVFQTVEEVVESLA